MSYVQTLYHTHPRSPITQLSEQTAAGGLITLLDFLLVNGGPAVNIESITRDGVNATIKTTEPHLCAVGDKIEIADTGESNFNGIKRVHAVLTTDEVVVRVEDTGSASTGAAGTIRYAPAGWTKYYSGTNEAIYQSAVLYDAAPFYLQVNDTTTVTARIRVGRNVTAMNVGELLTPETFIKKGDTNFVYCLFADNKTLHLSWNQTLFQSIGYGKKLDPELELLLAPSIYGPSPTSATQANTNYIGSQIGYRSDFHSSMTQANSSVCLLSQDNSMAFNSLGITTILGLPRTASAGSVLGTAASMQVLDSIQNGIRGVNTLTGKMQLCSVEVWEKIAEVGDCFQPNCRVRGLYQAYARLPFEYIDSLSDKFVRMTIKIDNVDTNFMVVNIYTSLASNSQLYINVDNWID